MRAATFLNPWFCGQHRHDRRNISQSSGVDDYCDCAYWPNWSWWIQLCLIYYLSKLVFQIWLILNLFTESQHLATCIQSTIKVWIPFKKCSFLLAYANNYRIPWWIIGMNCYIKARKCWVWFLAVAGPFLCGFVCSLCACVVFLLVLFYFKRLFTEAQSGSAFMNILNCVSLQIQALLPVPSAGSVGFNLWFGPVSPGQQTSGRPTQSHPHWM